MWHESKPNETEKGNRRLRDVVAFITRRSDVQIGFRVISTGLTAPHFPFPTRFSAFSYTNFHAQRKISIQNLFLAYKTGSIFFKALIELNEDVHFFAERCILRDDQIRVIFPLYTSSFFFLICETVQMSTESSRISPTNWVVCRCGLLTDISRLFWPSLSHRMPPSLFISPGFGIGFGFGWPLVFWFLVRRLRRWQIICFIIHKNYSELGVMRHCCNSLCFRG